MKHPIIMAFMYLLGALCLFLFSYSYVMAEEYIGADKATFETSPNLRDFVPKMGLIVPKDWEAKKRLKLPPLYDDVLPSRFSWKDVGLTPIRNQGNCGSCWAFSMTATLADVVKLHGLGNQDLSEQYLVSCDNSNYGCSGGWMEFSMFKKYGSVMEAEFPYVAKDVKCKSGLNYVYKLNDWGYVDGNVPDTETLKRIIYTYGPVSVAVAVAGRFSSYSSGIYNESSSGTVNHAVNLVGWDDTASPKHWIMRNSWGSSWGENGFMRIAYGSRKIGYAATFVDLKGPLPHGPTPTPEPTPNPTPTPEPSCGVVNYSNSPALLNEFWDWLTSLF